MEGAVATPVFALETVHRSLRGENELQNPHVLQLGSQVKDGRVLVVLHGYQRGVWELMWWLWWLGEKEGEAVGAEVKVLREKKRSHTKMKT